MPANKHDLIIIKRQLVSALTAVHEAGALGRRIGDDDLARRLRDIAATLSAELDRADQQAPGHTWLG